MAFDNPVVGGDQGTLKRDSIKSPNFAAGVSGWIIRRDGSAEFSNVTLRGSLVASDGSSSVVITNTSNPRIQFFKSGVVLPAEIIGFRPFGTGDTGIQFESAGTAGHDQAIEQLDEFGWRVLKNNNVVFGTDFADGSMNARLADGNDTFIPLLVDGKKVSSTSDTNSASTTDVTVTAANCVNTPLLTDRAYTCDVQIQLTSTVIGDRAKFKLWNGSVGTGAQLGGDVIKVVNVASASTFETVNFRFVWRGTADEIAANINLSVQRFSGTGTVTARVAAADYFIEILEKGSADRIGGL